MTDKKIILITGANSGIGYDSSYAVAAASASNHVIMGCRNLDKGAKALEELRARKPAGTLSLLELDVTRDASIAAAAERIEADFGVLDVLVNNAGICLQGAADRRTEMAQTLDANTIGPLVLAEALLPLLRRSRAGARIVNVSSALGSIGLRSDPDSDFRAYDIEPYRVSKAGLNMATACLQATCRPWGGRVWSFCPGYVVTNLTGEGDRQRRTESGADSSETSATGILEIIEGKRDHEAGLFLARWGKQHPW
ncbi:hypothetical protein CDD83_1625 [Cordyceps sp. RAO-2017]|nr:hypothetical protein CDD83_1625 [Cordyceps sp. RAO-2017]